MPSTYLPAREAELLAFAQNLFDHLEANPATYGQTIESIAPFGTAFNAFKAALAVTTNPATKTKPTIADKNAKKQAMIDIIRPLVQTLQNWSGMTDDKRDTLGIPTRDRQPTPIGPPEEMPVLRVAGVFGRLLELEVLDTEGKKRKPDGARGAWLYTHVGDDPPAELTAWQFRGGTTRSNPQVVFEDSVAPGTKVWVTALWVNPTDQPGPACAPQQTRIGYQGLSEAA